MSKRRMSIGLLLLVPVTAGAFLIQGREPADGARLFAQVLQQIEDNAVDSVSRSDLYEKAARGLIKNLRDPYADLYSPDELASFNRNTLRNNYGGLGMQIEPQDDFIVVARVFPGTPAAAGGVQPGDRILQVDTTGTTGMRLDQVSSRLVGQPGTSVDVVFQRPGITQPIKSRFVRAVIRVPAVPYTVVLDGNVGYIPLQSFNESSAEDMERSLGQLRTRGARSFILDLRGNGGGSLEQALEISNLFLADNQEIARVQHRSKSPEVYRANRMPVVDSMPVVVMVDGYSASASEIVAGSLQDHDRALVVGTTSFGKGLVQTLFQLQGGWALKLTTGKWYTPSGRSIQAEHDRLDDTRFVEYAPDSARPDSLRKRPLFRSDAGRTVLGGGGVTPDVVIQRDTVSPADRELLRAVGPSSQAWHVTLYNYALEQKSSIKPTFTVTPEMREEFFQRLTRAKVPVIKAQFDAAADGFVTRQMEEYLTRLAFGDSAVFRRQSRNDPQLASALDYLRRGVTQRQMLALASGEAKTRPQQR